MGENIAVGEPPFSPHLVLDLEGEYTDPIRVLYYLPADLPLISSEVGHWFRENRLFEVAKLYLSSSAGHGMLLKTWKQPRPVTFRDRLTGFWR